MAGFLILKMKIEINNRQKLYRPDITRIKELVKKLLQIANKLNPDTKWEEISIVLVDNDYIKTLNMHFFGRNEITDVISLRFDPVPGDKYLTGEIFINVQQALNYSLKRRFRWNASKELALYLAHGCDHLMDSTDHDEAGYKRMRRRELGWLKKRNIAISSKKLLKTT
jgi:rRNA maturation RNase YbeY